MRPRGCSRPAPLRGPRIGFADDATKYGDDGAQLFDRLNAVGAVENRVALFWDPAQPATIQERDFLDRMLPVAQAKGVRIVFSVYPRSPQAFTTDAATRITQFADYLALLARTYPQVRDDLVLNEPNEAYFWAPQHDANGRIISAQVAYRVLAAGYDAALLRGRPSLGCDPSITAILRVGGKISLGTAERAMAGTSCDASVVGSGPTFIKGGGRIPVTFGGGLVPGRTSSPCG